MIYSWRGGTEACFRLASGKQTPAGGKNELAEGMEAPPCEKWEAERKDLFNKPARGNQTLTKMLEEKHTLNKDENQNLQIPKTENQKKK